MYCRNSLLWQKANGETWKLKNRFLQAVPSFTQSNPNPGKSPLPPGPTKERIDALIVVMLIETSEVGKISQQAWLTERMRALRRLPQLPYVICRETTTSYYVRISHDQDELLAEVRQSPTFSNFMSGGMRYKASLCPNGFEIPKDANQATFGREAFKK